MPRPTKVSGLFASGLATPFRGDSDGGAALSEGSSYIEEQVLATVRPNTSDNPFQDLGIGEQAIFQNPSDPTWKRAMRERIVRQFATLESNNLARLTKVEFATTAEGGDFAITILYVNLETNSADSTAVQLVQTAEGSLRPF